jgi:hypothetical protein
MSTKQTELSGNGHANLAGIAEQTMLATVGIANQGVTLLREAAQGVVTVADAVVDGTLDVASVWGKNTPMEPFTSAPVDMARKTWVATRDTASRLLVGA